MPILASEFKYYKSTSGVGLGGAINLAAPIVNAAMNNIFDNVSPSEAAAGDVEYRCIYVRNENSSIDLLAAKAYIAANTPSTATNIEIGLGTSGANSVEQTIPNEGTAPAGVTFSSPLSAATGLDMATIAANNGYYPLWIKRSIAAAATPVESDSFTLAVEGETVR